MVIMALTPISACVLFLAVRAEMHESVVMIAFSCTASFVLVLSITAVTFYTQRREALFRKELLSPELFEKWQRGRTHKW